MDMIQKLVHVLWIILRDIQPYFVKVAFGLRPLQNARHQGSTFTLLCGKPLTAPRLDGFNIQWRCIAAVYPPVSRASAPEAVTRATGRVPPKGAKLPA
jgi:hypothetical protein